VIQEGLSVRAAQGDHDAQFELANHMAQLGVAGDIPLDHALTLALTWSSMAATSGRSSHLLGYAAILLANTATAPEELVEAGEFEEDFAAALAIVDAVADLGHSRAGAVSFALASRLAPGTLARARELKPWVGAVPLTDAEQNEDSADLDGIISALGIQTTGSC
jgi:hypothetical protein